MVEVWRCCSGTLEAVQSTSHRYSRRSGGVAVLGAVQQPQVLVGDSGGGDLPVDVADVQLGQQPVPGEVGEVFEAAARYSGSSLRPQWPVESCCRRRRTSPTAANQAG